MGCLKLHTDQGQEPSPFLGVWKGGALEKSDTHFFEVLDEKGGQLNFCIDYYPFGGRFNSWHVSPKNNYLFNGKEDQPETEWYDYGARMQDPWLGRWFNIDPLASRYERMSPYNYAANNPILFIDPDGMRIKLHGNREDKKMIRQTLREIRRHSKAGKQAIKDLRKSKNVHNIRVVRFSDPGVGKFSESQLKGMRGNERVERNLQERKDNSQGLLSSEEKSLATEVASGGSAAHISTAQSNRFLGINDRSDVNGDGSGTNILLNGNEGVGTIVHELGHALKSDEGAQPQSPDDINLMLQSGASPSFARTLNESVADGFANTVIQEMAGKSKLVPANSNYTGYNISQDQIKSYNEALKRLKTQ